MDASDPGLTRFFGDVIVYQRHRAEIQERVRDTIHAHDPLLGTEERPAFVVGHSLGGVIAFDLAVATKPPLVTAALLTFGSQAPFFHVVDPRTVDLPAYALDQPVTLPGSLGRWTNLWEPLDLVGRSQ